MASGVKISAEVMSIFNDMKVRKAQMTLEEKKQRKKAMLFCVTQDLKQIAPEEGKEILHGDLSEMGGDVEDAYQRFVQLFPPDDCRYALFDATFETKETKKEDLVFVFWSPDSAPIKMKMIYASSKDAIKKNFTGLKHEWQVTGMEDLIDRANLADKLGGVVTLEGKKV